MGPLRVSNVLRPDNRVAGPWVGRGLFRLRLGAVERVFCGCLALVGWRIFCAQVGAYFRVRLGPGGVVRILCAALGLSCLL